MKNWLLFLSVLTFGLSGYAGIPVTDVGNAKQHILSTIESVNQSLKQIEQLQLQLRQYEQQIKDAAAPSTYVWGKALDTVKRIQRLSNSVKFLQAKYGDVAGFVDNFKDVNYYRSSPCYNELGCPDFQDQISEQRVATNKDLFQGSSEQMENLSVDTDTLQQLQNQAAGADGHLKAIGATNQLAAFQIQQLLQLRQALLQQNQALSMHLQAQADKEAQQAAASKAFRKPKFRSSPDKGFTMGSAFK